MKLRDIIKLGEELRFPAGESITQAGSQEVGFYLILDGRVELRGEGRPPLKLGKGDFFGDQFLLLGQPHPSVVALEPTRCFVLTPWSFQGLVRLHPDLQTRISGELARRTKGGPGPSP
jgi:CRP-like cAMP-binding protein